MACYEKRDLPFRRPITSGEESFILTFIIWVRGILFDQVLRRDLSNPKRGTPEYWVVRRGVPNHSPFTLRPIINEEIGGDPPGVTV